MTGLEIETNYVILIDYLRQLAETGDCPQEIMEEEYFFNCPYCWQEISMLIDPFSGDQTYVEDCEICCNPIEISYQVENGEIISFGAKRLE